MDSSDWLPPDICRWAETPTTSVPPLDCGISAVTPPELMDELCENSLPQLETSTATRITRMSIKVTRRRPARKLNICPLALHADQNAGNPQHHADPGLLELRHRNPLGAGELHPVVPGWPRSAADGGGRAGGGCRLDPA